MAQVSVKRTAWWMRSSRQFMGTSRVSAPRTTEGIWKLRSHKPFGKTNVRHFTTDKAAAQNSAKTNKKNDSNVFLDNLGKIFLATIATIIVTLIRSSYNTSNRNKVRDMVEDVSVIDPIELDELRIANSELDPEVFRAILRDLSEQYPEFTCSYREFIGTVRKTMVGLKGSAFTIELGHLVDRVVLDILKKYEKTADEPLPLSLWMAILSMALNSTVNERIQLLFEVMKAQGSSVVFTQVEEMVGHLQDSCQLPPDTQIIPTETKYPTQQWERGTPNQLVLWDGSPNEDVDVEAFASILRTKSVCAWGECYHKKKI